MPGRVLLLAATLIACGGSRPAPPEPPVAPAPAAATELPSNEAAAPAACATTRDCIAACERTEPGACMRAYGFVWHQLAYVSDGDHYEEAVGHARRACDQGDPAGCGVIAEFGDYQGLPEAEILALARSACDGGDPGGCETLSGIAADQRATLLARARDLRETACTAGDGDACHELSAMFGSHVGYLGEETSAFEPDPAAAERWLRLAIEHEETACTGGDPLACIRRVWLYQHDQLGKQEPHPKTWADRACSLVGADPGCWEGDQPVIFGWQIDDRL